MKISRFLVLIIPLLLTACGLSDQQQADYAVVKSSDVSSAIYDKMMHGDQLSLYDIKALSHARVKDAIIVRYMRDHESVYYLNSSDVEGLSQAGVSQSVIDYMLTTPQTYAPGAPVPVSVGVVVGPGWYGPHPGWYGPRPYPYRRW